MQKPMNLQLFAESQGGGGDGSPDAGVQQQTMQQQAGTEKTFTQAEVDAIIAQRLARGKQEPYQAIDTQELVNQLAVALGERIHSTSQQPQQTSKPSQENDALQAAQNALNEARQLRVQTSLETMAVQAGVNPDALPLLINSVDTSDVNVEGTTVDQEALQKKLNETLEKYPMLRGNQGGYSGGANPGGQQKLDESSFGAMLGKKKAESKQRANEAFKGLLGQ